MRESPLPIPITLVNFGRCVLVMGVVVALVCFNDCIDSVTRIGNTMHVPCPIKYNTIVCAYYTVIMENL